MSLEPLTRLFRVIEEFRKLDSQLPMQTAAVLILVAKEPGISQVNLLERAGVSRSAISRIFDKLSDRRDGLGLLTMREDPDDLRYKKAALTSKGRRVVASLEACLEG